MRTEVDRLPDALTRALEGAAETLGVDARARIRTRVMAEVGSGKRRRFFAAASHRTVAAATLVGMLGGGVAYAANAALPGDALYALKRGAEDVAVALLPPGQLEDGLLLRLAERRAGEAASLARSGATHAIIDDAVGQLREAVRQAAPAEGSLGEDEAARIREQADLAPEPYRSDIEDAVIPAGPGDGPDADAPTGEPAPAAGESGGGSRGSGDGEASGPPVSSSDDATGSGSGSR